MPTFLVEDGSIVADATSYVEIVEALDIASLRSDAAAFTGATQAEQERWLMMGAMGLDKLTRKRLKGYLVQATQSLMHPRYSMIDDQGVCRSSTTIADEVKESAVALAIKAASFPTASLAATALDSATGSSGGAILEVEEKVDVLSTRTKYSEGATVITDPTKVGLIALTKSEILTCMAPLLNSGMYVVRG